MRRSRLTVKPNIGGAKGGPLPRSSRPSVPSTCRDKQKETSQKCSESEINNVPITISHKLGSKESRLTRFASLNSKPDTDVSEKIYKNISNDAIETDLSSTDSSLGEEALTHTSTKLAVTDIETEENTDKNVITAEKSPEIELTSKAPSPENFTVIKDKTVQTVEPKEKETTTVTSVKVQCNSNLLKNTQVKNLLDCTKNTEEEEIITEKTLTSKSVEKDEKHEDKGAKMLAPRPRSRFTKARPNLGDAVRPRIRNLSGGGDVTKEVNKPQRSLSTTRENATHTGVTGKNCFDGSNNNITENKLIEEENNKDSAKGVTSDREKAKKDSSVEGEKNQGVIKNEETKRKRRKMEWLSAPVDKSKLTMRDLIYMNPISNPMQSTVEEKERRRKQKDEQKKMGMKSSASVCSEVPVPSPPESILVSDDDDDSQPKEDHVKEDEKEELSIEKKDEEEGEALPVPQVRIGPDGQIILNEQSLLITQKENGNVSETEVIHERDDNPSRAYWYGRKTQTKQWTDKETKKFYLALSAVGTDFSLMTNLFPKRTRTELKRKFKREEKHHKDLVDTCIREQQQFDMDFFQTLSKLNIDDDPPVKKERESRKRKSAKAVSSERTSDKDNEDSGDTVVSTRSRRTNVRKRATKKNWIEDSDSEEENKAELPKLVRPSAKQLLTEEDDCLMMDQMSSDDDYEPQVTSCIQKHTRSGRMPKQSKAFTIEHTTSKVRKRGGNERKHDGDKCAHVNDAQNEEERTCQTPLKRDKQNRASSPIGRTCQTPPKRDEQNNASSPIGSSTSSKEQADVGSGFRSPKPPGEYINVSSMDEMEEGSLVFVTGNQGATSTDSGDVIHVYVVSSGAGEQTEEHVGNNDSNKWKSILKPRTPSNTCINSEGPETLHTDKASSLQTGNNPDEAYVIFEPCEDESEEIEASGNDKPVYIDDDETLTEGEKDDSLYIDDVVDYVTSDSVYTAADVGELTYSTDGSSALRIIEKPIGDQDDQDIYESDVICTGAETGAESEGDESTMLIIDPKEGTVIFTSAEDTQPSDSSAVYTISAEEAMAMHMSLSSTHEIPTTTAVSDILSTMMSAAGDVPPVLDTPVKNSLMGLWNTKLTYSPCVTDKTQSILGQTINQEISEDTSEDVIMDPSDQSTDNIIYMTDDIAMVTPINTKSDV